MSTQETREAWLVKAITRLRPIFQRVADEMCTCHEAPLPENIRVSVGFPRGVRKAIGQAWQAANSKDSTYEIFISPVLDESIRVLDVLAHELIHTIVGSGHKKPFTRIARAIGLEGKVTATYTSDGSPLHETLTKIADSLGEYPHAALDPTTGPVKKQGTRMIKLECMKCGCIVRTTQKWIDTYVTWTCPCGQAFELERKDDDE